MLKAMWIQEGRKGWEMEGLGGPLSGEVGLQGKGVEGHPPGMLLIDCIFTH